MRGAAEFFRGAASLENREHGWGGAYEMLIRQRKILKETEFRQEYPFLSVPYSDIDTEARRYVEKAVQRAINMDAEKKGLRPQEILTKAEIAEIQTNRI